MSRSLAWAREDLAVPLTKNLTEGTRALEGLAVPGIVETIAGAFSGEASIDRTLDALVSAGGTVLHILLILVVSFLLVRASNALIDRLIIQRVSEGRKLIDERKARTLRSLLKSVARYAIYIFAGISILGELGVNTASLLAGAGLAGIAIGFGAQNLVRDIINGFFILFEDQFAVGDYVTVGDVSGIVEAIGLRATQVRGFGGELYVIPNGQISSVTNHMGSAMRVMFTVAVSYETDIDRAIAVLESEFEKAKVEISDIVEGPKVLGVNALAQSGVELLILARTRSMEQWRVERELKKRVKEALDREGIAIPYPHMQVVLDKGPQG